MRRVRVKPSKSQSLVGMIAGGIFVVIGFSVILNFGLFGIVWTLFAVIIMGMNAYNFFSKEGVASWEIDVNADHDSFVQEDDFEEKLRKLNRLKEEGLITENEFEAKRNEIMRSEW
jgi:hypothetical protein